VDGDDELQPVRQQVYRRLELPRPTRCSRCRAHACGRCTNNSLCTSCRDQTQSGSQPTLAKWLNRPSVEARLASARAENKDLRKQLRIFERARADFRAETQELIAQKAAVAQSIPQIREQLATEQARAQMYENIQATLAEQNGNDIEKWQHLEAETRRLRQELEQWKKGELEHKELIDAETGDIESIATPVLTKRPRAAASDISSRSLALLLDQQDKLVSVKQETEVLTRERAELKDRLEDTLQCVVCMARERSVVFQPCNHFVCCEVCAQEQHCPSSGCGTAVSRRLRGVSMAPHQQCFDIG